MDTEGMIVVVGLALAITLMLYVMQTRRMPGRRSKQSRDAK